MKQSIKLRGLVYRAFLSSAIIPLLVIELCLLLLYFGANWYVMNRYQETLLDQIHQTIGESNRKKSENIDLVLGQVQSLANVMQADHEAFFRQLPQCNPVGFEEAFTRHDNGALIKTTNQGASLYYAAHVKMTDEVRRKAVCSEVLDDLLIAFVNNNTLVTQAYLNTRDDMNRLYPFMQDAAVQYGPDLHMADHNFYYLADAEHNPTRQPVWTDMYLDPAGQGWMTSVIVPIYHAGVLEGVSGLDITIDSIVKRVLEDATGAPGGQFLVNQHGTILAMPPAIEKIFKLDELKSHRYDSVISETVYKPDEYNLLNSQFDNVRQRVAELLQQPRLAGQLDNIDIDGNTYLLNVQPIKATGWRLFTLVDRQAALKPIEELRQSIRQVGFVAMLVMLLFYILFFIYLEHKSRGIAARLSAPLEAISRWSSKLGTGAPAARLESVGIEEFDELHRQVNRVNGELEQRTRELVEARTREEIRTRETEMLERLASTDRLSGLYNRRKLDELLQIELERCQRSGEDFSVILLDIDHFKSINDNFGHNIGDGVIEEIARFLRSGIRKVDSVGRWGGEEFMIICPMTGLAGAVSLAESLRSAIAGKQFDEIGQMTASLGVAAWNGEEPLRELINRADEGLYKAKEAGRNRVGCTDLEERNSQRST